MIKIKAEMTGESTGREREKAEKTDRKSLFGWFFNILVNNQAISRTGPKTILRAAPHETERRDQDFCLSRSHNTESKAKEQYTAEGHSGKQQSSYIKKKTN